MGTLKKCAKCDTEKPLDAFNNNSSSKDGKQRYCRECNKMYGRKYYKTHTKGERAKKNEAKRNDEAVAESTANSTANEDSGT